MTNLIDVHAVQTVPVGLNIPTTPYALDHALAYAAMRMPVLALAPGTKAPATARGFKDATTDPEIIRRWFADTPGAGVGIHPGPGRLLVLDIDDRPGKDGLARVAQLQATHGDLPATLRQKTPSGRGHHLFFGVPEGWEVGNASPWPGIDVRSGSGYVVAEPTRLDGATRTYSFDDWDVTSGEVPDIAPAPDWLLGALAKPVKPEQSNTTVEGVGESVPDQTVADLRSALNVLDADDRDVWVRQGMALKSLGTPGRGLWMDWSEQSEKFDPRDALKTWDSLKPDRIGYAAVFRAAQDAGWGNPAKKVPNVAVDPSGGLPGPSASAEVLAASFRVVDISRLDDIKQQEWWWEDYIPAGHVTMLSAHGGTGKSTLALWLAVHLALGLEFLGKATTPARVLFFSGEDPADMIKRRLAVIVDSLALSLPIPNLWVIDATEFDPALFTELDGRHKPGTTTGTYTDLADFVVDNEIDVVMVDNASDVFAGDEINRSKVRQFLRSLAQLVRSRSGAVLLLAHVDKGTSRAPKGAPPDTEGYSGSTAWHNSVRSRLFMRESETGLLELQHQKSNLGRKQAPLMLVWDGTSLPEVATIGGGGNLVDDPQSGPRTLTLLGFIHEYSGRGEHIAASANSPRNIVKLCRDEPGFPQGLKPAQAAQLLREAQRGALVVVQTYRGLDRKPHERWAVTLAGLSLIGVAPSAPTTVTSIEPSADDEHGAWPVPSAPSALGGVGGGARTRKSARKSAQVTEGPDLKTSVAAA